MSIPNIIIALASHHRRSLIELAVMFVARREKKPENRQVKTLAEAIGRQRPIISRAVVTLVGAGLVTTEYLCGDRRTCVVSLTDAGRDCLRAVEAGRVVE
jgi:DNA-binding MarR family transcriptional regulator